MNFWASFALPSVTSVVVVIGWPFLRRDDRRVIFLFAAISGAVLYATSLGIVPFDVYRAGFSAAAPFVLALLAAMMARQATRAAGVALLVLIAFDVNLLPSRNLFDYAVDPLIFVVACIWCFVEFVLRSSSS